MATERTVLSPWRALSAFVDTSGVVSRSAVSPCARHGERQPFHRQALGPFAAHRPAPAHGHRPAGTADASLVCDYRSWEEQMTVHRATPTRVHRSFFAVPVLLGLLMARTPLGATPAPQANHRDTERDVGADLLPEVVNHRAARSAGDGRTLFTWTGRVDREVLLVVRGREVVSRGFDAALPSRTRVNAALPRTNSLVRVELFDGRGDVDVLEQPSARNGYQAVLRVRDPRAGADSYRFTAYLDDDRDGIGFRGENRGRERDRRADGDWADDPRRGRNSDGQRSTAALQWSGRVDDVVEIHLSGRRVDAITRSGTRVSDVAATVRGRGLPNRNVRLYIDQHAGRGDIVVVQQPSAWNGYTAVIRIYDARSGAAFYDFTAYWD